MNSTHSSLAKLSSRKQTLESETKAFPGEDHYEHQLHESQEDFPQQTWLISVWLISKVAFAI